MTPEAEPKKDDAKPAAPGEAPKADAPVSDPPPKPPAPRYRYFTVPPATVRLPVDDLTALLPAGAWIGSDADKRRELALPTAEVLEKNFPRIRFSRLSDLLPGCIRAVENAPEWIVLPTDRVALAYQPETRREPLAEPEKKPAAPAETAASTAKPTANEPAKPLPAWKRLLKPILAPPPEPAKAGETSESSEGPRPVETVAPPAAASVSPIEPAKPASAPEPPKPVPLAEVRVSPEAEARLQQAFMTEEELPVARLIALGGALPNLQGVILRRGGETVRSDESLAGIDDAALTAGARQILQTMGGTSGLRFKAAVTLYAESGPISFLEHGPLQLVVRHRERAFLPGVREKLEAILEAIAAAS